ncbi:hypothetical protein NW198_05040 [Thermophilibacter sp. ET337]|uniref:hypothetical protein n=1 Tax=Thermophilibacter sp. ET337 TaxID=2973084 RepID=UPI0021AD3C36|nr:hypothetical protein [Thermophilibacter sp. ET337]MCR8907983.1 hypothetical protein [Thermophilibacter sp. ET337]
MGELVEKVKDASLAIVESGTETVLDNLPKLSAALTQAGLHGAASVVADGVVGAVAPGVFGAVMGYKVRRFERNVIELISELSASMDKVNERLDRLDENQRRKFSEGMYRDAFLDSIVNENEPEKVAYCVHAFINAMGEEGVSDSFMVALFDDLSRLSRLDIRVLNLHGGSYFTEGRTDDDYNRLISEEGIDESQCRSIRQKLCRFGLLQSKNEEKREQNLEEVQEALSELIKNLNSNKIKKLHDPKYQRITRSDSYAITPLGRRYLRMMRQVDEPE